jgi:hypothetical protein
MAGAAFDGEGTLFLLEDTEVDLDLMDLGVEVVVSLQVGLDAPVAQSVGLCHDLPKDWGVGGDAIDEPVGDGVGCVFEDKGGESMKLVEMHAVPGAAEGALDKAGAREASDISGLEIDSIFFDEEVRDAPCVLLEAVGALGLREGTSRGAGLVRWSCVLLQLFDMGGEDADGLVCTGKADTLGCKGLVTLALHGAEAVVEAVRLIDGDTSCRLRQQESNFGGKALPMGGKDVVRGARRWWALAKEGTDDVIW